VKFLAAIGLAWVGVVFWSLFLSACAYLLVCLGLHPESIDGACLVVPLLSVFCVASVAACSHARRAPGKVTFIGMWLGVVIVFVWFSVWCYLLGRNRPEWWWSEGVHCLSREHFLDWFLILVVSLAGNLFGSLAAKRKVRTTSLAFLAMFLALVSLSAVALLASGRWNTIPVNSWIAPGANLRADRPQPDGTGVFFFSFDFAANPNLRLRLYDADSDDASPLDDANTSYMGQSLDLVQKKLDRRLKTEQRKLLCVFNAGFFGAHGDRVAHHEAPICVDRVAHYDVDLMRPPDQWCVFGVSLAERISGGAARFRVVSRVPFEQWPHEFETGIAGVRPLRLSGNSVPLAPGIGSTFLKCSRTSIGWNETADKLFVVIVRDPDSEGASNLQRKSGGQQTGGWDVAEVQKFWQQQNVANAVLLDGGESTQMAWREQSGEDVFLRGGYHSCLPLGHWRGRPVLAFPAMLPRLQNYRGVLNYLYIDDKVLD